MATSRDAPELLPTWGMIPVMLSPMPISLAPVRTVQEYGWFAPENCRLASNDSHSLALWTATCSGVSVVIPVRIGM